VLHGGGELPELVALALVDLVERDQQPGPLLREQVEQHRHLVEEPRRADVVLGRIPCGAATDHRSGEPNETGRCRL